MICLGLGKPRILLSLSACQGLVLVDAYTIPNTIRPSRELAQKSRPNQNGLTMTWRATIQQYGQIRWSCWMNDSPFLKEHVETFCEKPAQIGLGLRIHIQHFKQQFNMNPVKELCLFWLDQGIRSISGPFSMCLFKSVCFWKLLDPQSLENRSCRRPHSHGHREWHNVDVMPWTKGAKITTIVQDLHWHLEHHFWQNSKSIVT